MSVRPLLILVFLAVCPLAFAQDKQSDLETQLSLQKARLAALEKQMEELKAGQAAASASRKAESERQKTLLTLEYSNGFKMSYKDPRSGNKRFAFQIFGRIQIDGQVRLDGSDRKHGSSTLNTFKERRVYVGGKATLYTYWHAVFNIELGDRVTSNETNYIANTYLDQANFRIGQFYIPLFLEGNISNKYIRLIERSMAVNFATPFTELGFMVHGALANKKVNYWLMVSNGNKQARIDNDDLKSVRGRLLFRPTEGLHVGVSGGYGKHDNLAPGAHHGSGVSTAPGTRVISYVPSTVIDGEVVRAGAELGWHSGPFGIWGEYLYMKEDLADRFSIGLLERVNRKDVTWQGGHVTVAYFLTGEKMTFGRPNVLKPMEPGQPDSGNGAWELTARYDWIKHDGAEGDLEGFFLQAHQPDKVQQIMAGVNWYPNPMVKVSMQWQHAWWNRAIKDDDAIIGIGVSRPKHQDTLMMRVQIEF